MFAQYFPHFPQLLIAWGVFLAFGLAIYLFEIVRSGQSFSPKDLWRHCIPFDVKSDRGFHTDIKINLVEACIGFLFPIPGLLIATALCHAVTLGAPTIAASSSTSDMFVIIALCGLTMFILAEFSDFLFHLLEHKVPELWELHKLHHSAHHLNPLTARRMHPVSVILNGLVRGLVSGIPAGMFVVLGGLPVAEVLALPLITSKIFSITSLNPLKHSHHQISLGALDRLLISPHMHQIHHSAAKPHLNKNFGTHLSIFDWMFGTVHRPEKGEAPEWGIAGFRDEQLHSFNSMFGAYVRPLVAVGTMLGRRCARARRGDADASKRATRA